MYTTFFLSPRYGHGFYWGVGPGSLYPTATALKPGGRLLLTLENLPDGGGSHGYRLASTGRFCHSAAYVQRTLAMAGLVDASIDAITPRLEYGEPVDGLLVTACRLDYSGSL